MSTTPSARALPKTTNFVVPNGSIAAESLGVVEGQRSASTEKVTVKPLMVGNDMLLLEIFQEKGLKVPRHQHESLTPVCALCRALRLAPGTQRVAPTHESAEQYA